MNRTNTLVIFDIDGTIAHHGTVVSPHMRAFLQRVRERVSVAVIGGSPLRQIYDKVGHSVLTDVDYVFAENGLVAYKDGKLLKEMVRPGGEEGGGGGFFFSHPRLTALA